MCCLGEGKPAICSGEAGGKPPPKAARAKRVFLRNTPEILHVNNLQISAFTVAPNRRGSRPSCGPQSRPKGRVSIRSASGADNKLLSFGSAPHRDQRLRSRLLRQQLRHLLTR